MTLCRRQGNTAFPPHSINNFDLFRRPHAHNLRDQPSGACHDTTCHFIGIWNSFSHSDYSNSNPFLISDGGKRCTHIFPLAVQEGEKRNHQFSNLCKTLSELFKLYGQSSREAFAKLYKIILNVRDFVPPCGNINPYQFLNIFRRNNEALQVEINL